MTEADLKKHSMPESLRNRKGESMKLRKKIAWILALAMIVSLLGTAGSVFADPAPAEGEAISAEGESAEGESAEEAAPAEGESAEGESAEDAAPAEGESAEEAAPAEGESTEDAAAAEGESADGESAEGESGGDDEWTGFPADGLGIGGDQGGSESMRQDIVLEEGDNKYYEGIDWTGTEGFLALNGGVAQVGGFQEHYLIKDYLLAVTPKYFEASNVDYDWTVNSRFQGTADAAGGGAIFNVTGAGSTLSINNAYISAMGSQTAALCLEGNHNKVVIQDSYLETKGSVEGYEAVDDFMSLGALTVWGHTRSSLSMGVETDTFYYNSVIVSDGWGALSTDGSTGMGLNLVAVNSYAEAADGGYALFSDHECRDYLIGTTLVGAEYGCIICSAGEIYFFGGESGFQNRQELGTLRAKILESFPKNPLTLSENQQQNFSAEHPIYAMADYMDVDMEVGRSTVVGGRNSVNMVTPDLMNEGPAASVQNILVAFNTDLVTDFELFNLDDMPEGQYTPDSVTSSAATFNADTLNYVKWTAGPAIILRSDSAFICLDDVTFTSNYDQADFGQPNTFIMSVLNSDSSACVIPDGMQVAPMEVFIGHSTIEGDILDYDYHRQLMVVLTGTEYTGAIKSYTVDDWNAIWGEGGTLGTGCYVYDETYESVWLPKVFLSEGAVWNVTEECFVGDLAIDTTSQVNGNIEQVDGGFLITPLEG